MEDPLSQKTIRLNKLGKVDSARHSLSSFAFQKEALVAGPSLKTIRHIFAGCPSKPAETAFLYVTENFVRHTLRHRTIFLWMSSKLPPEPSKSQKPKDWIFSMRQTRIGLQQRSLPCQYMIADCRSSRTAASFTGIFCTRILGHAEHCHKSFGQTTLDPFLLKKTTLIAKIER